MIADMTETFTKQKLTIFISNAKKSTSIFVLGFVVAKITAGLGSEIPFAFTALIRNPNTQPERNFDNFR
jgi:hypothetical protein